MAKAAPKKKPVAKKPAPKAPPAVKLVSKTPVKPPVASKPEPGHNSGGIAKSALTSVIDRVERLEEEKRGLTDDIKDIYTDAKGKGLDVPTIRKIIVIRRKEKEKLIAEKELLDLYMFVLDPDLADVLS